jgi:predicted branched-subunit amino acid permease
VLFRQGMRAGIPIGLGYFAVSFSLGIAARAAGITAFQGFLFSALGLASAGEYAAFTVIAAAGTYLEMALVTLVANARYLLMSWAMSQRMDPSAPLRHRLGMGYFITDEIFAVTISRPGWLSPWYMYGAGAVAAPCWAVGTALGVLAGQALPVRAVSALSVALYGMFLAVILPAAKENRVVAALVLASFALSWAAGVLPGLSALSAGTRTILLTVLIAGAAAALRPVEEKEGEA